MLVTYLILPSKCTVVAGLIIIAFPIYSDYVHVGCIPPSLIPNIAIPLYPNISNFQRTQK